MVALVLSGGSIRGSWQAGAIRAVCEAGYMPEYIYGISVGAMNSAFINDRAGAYYQSLGAVDWYKITDDLIRFWKEKITCPNDLITKRSTVKLIWNILNNKFDGLVDNAPLRKLVHDTIDIENLKKSPIHHNVGITNFRNGNIEYCDPQFTHNFLDCVIASTSIPVTMPAMIIGDLPYFDGGIRDIAPLSAAIKSGAETIIAILCQPENISATTANHRNIIQLLERTTDIMCNEIETNDINECLWVNDNLDKMPEKRHINLIVIRPDKDLDIDIQDFGSGEIAQMINAGYEQGKKVLAS